MKDKLKLGKVEMKINAKIGNTLYELFYGKDINTYHNIRTNYLKRYNEELKTGRIIRFNESDKLRIDVAIANLIRNIIDKKIKEVILQECEEHLIG